MPLPPVHVPLPPAAAENARVMLEEKVPVINFALGKGDWIVKGAHEYGGKVIATVVNARHAKRAAGSAMYRNIRCSTATFRSPSPRQ